MSTRSWHEKDMPTLRIEVKNSDDGSVIDLEGGSIKLHYWYGNDPATVVTGTVENASEGIAKASIGGSGLPQAGLIQWVWVISDGTSTWTSERTFSRKVERYR